MNEGLPPTSLLAATCAPRLAKGIVPSETIKLLSGQEQQRKHQTYHLVLSSHECRKETLVRSVATWSVEIVITEQEASSIRLIDIHLMKAVSRSSYWHRVAIHADVVSVYVTWEVLPLCNDYVKVVAERRKTAAVGENEKKGQKISR
jgi:hypothetical protein